MQGLGATVFADIVGTVVRDRKAHAGVVRAEKAITFGVNDHRVVLPGTNGPDGEAALWIEPARAHEIEHCQRNAVFLETSPRGAVVHEPREVHVVPHGVGGRWWLVLATTCDHRRQRNQRSEAKSGHAKTLPCK